MLRSCAVLAVALIAAGCTTAPPPPAATPFALPNNFDGRYTGTIRTLTAVVGFRIDQCQTDPRFSADVRNNAFTYVQPHPNSTNPAAGFTADSVSPSYSVVISPDGVMRGTTPSYSGVLSGTVNGRHMSGRIDGSLCTYSFEADRF